MNQELLRKDRMRFVKNKASANLAYLSIVFNVLYFVSIYSSNVGDYYYSILMGVSVVYNLLFLLSAFLSSEGLKSYKRSYAILITVVGALQLVRISDRCDHLDDKRRNPRYGYWSVHIHRVYADSLRCGGYCLRRYRIYPHERSREI